MYKDNIVIIFCDGFHAWSQTLETFSTKGFMLMANCKQQFQVRHLVLDFCDLYQFSYENMKG